MSKQKIYLSAALSTLLFSGMAIADGVQNDLESDMTYGHSAGHKDPVLMHPSVAQKPDLRHANGQDESSLLHQINTDRVKLSSSPSSPPTLHHATGDDFPNMIHEVSEHPGT